MFEQMLCAAVVPVVSFVFDPIFMHDDALSITFEEICVPWA
jgi:hypothetical protein